jgi:predicted acyl esterase
MIQHPRFPSTEERQEQGTETDKNLDLVWGLKIPMRDGTRLNATVYKPKDTQPAAAVFTLFFSRQIAKGSRLRLVICCPNSIYVEKNYNSGGVVADESGQDARTAHVTLYHDDEHPSFLELPIVTPPQERSQ